jgi:hypothetical protein
LAEGSRKIGLASIIPVSAFGFGTAMPTEPAEEFPINGGVSPYSEGEVEWLLKPDAAPEPFNLTALVWWCLMGGLLFKPADEGGEELARVARMLNDDLRAMDAWVVPLNCRGGR